MQAVAIVTDTATDISPELAASLGLQLVPVDLVIDGVPYEDYAAISREEFYARLAAGGQISTAGASVGAFVRAYERARAVAPEIVVVGMPAHLSVTTTSARTAIDLVEDARVTVVETGVAGTGLAALALWAARAAQTGADRAAVVAGLEARLRQAATWSITPSRQMLQAITARFTGDPAVAAGYTLALVQLENSRFFPFGGARDYDEAFAAVLDRMAAFYGETPLHVCTTQARAAAPAERLIAAVRARFACRTLDAFEAGPVSAGAMGLGLVSVGACPA